MLYKQDWEPARKRIEAFWNGEMVDRCAVAVAAPLHAEKLSEAQGRLEAMKKNDPVRYWTDIDFNLSTREEIFKNTYYGGEAIPNLFTNLGPSVVCAYMGSGAKFLEDTVWFDDIIEEWDKGLHLDEDSNLLKLTFDYTLAAVEAGKGKYFVSTTDLGGTGDVLAALRGNENLCVDLFENPDEVKAAVKFISKVWMDVFNKQCDMISDVSEGCPSRLIWAPGSHYPLQCDFSAMLSSSQFNKFFLDDIIQMCNDLEYPMFHLDGPDIARTHLDSILAIKVLRAIQWVPGAGSPPLAHWIPMLRKIQDAGKGAYFGASPQDLDMVFDNLIPERCFILTSASSKEEADEIICYIEKRSKE